MFQKPDAPDATQVIEKPNDAYRQVARSVIKRFPNREQRHSAFYDLYDTVIVSGRGQRRGLVAMLDHLLVGARQRGAKSLPKLGEGHSGVLIALFDSKGRHQGPGRFSLGMKLEVDHCAVFAELEPCDRQPLFAAKLV